MTDSAGGTADGVPPEPTPLTSDDAAVDDATSGDPGPAAGGTAATEGSTSIDGSSGTDGGALPSLHPAPGDLNDLSPEQLAATGQWTALATLAHHRGQVGPGLQALRQLAEHAAIPDVFRWLWAVLADQPREAWAELVHLPSGLLVPPDLVDAVAAEVSSAATQNHRRAQAHAALLRALDPDDAGTAQIAWAVLTSQTAPEESVVTRAVALLGASHDPQVRDRVLAQATAAARADPPQTHLRIQLAASLAPPLSTAEATAAFDAVHALTEARRSGAPWDLPGDPQQWELLQRLLRHLPLDLLRQALAGAWLDERNVAASVLTPAFLASLGQPVLNDLLEAGLSVAAPALRAMTSTLPDLRGLLADPAALELVEHAHRVLPERALSGLRDRLVALAEDAALFLEIGDAASRLQRQWSIIALQRAALATPPGWTPPPAPPAATGDRPHDAEQVQQWLAQSAPQPALQPVRQPAPQSGEAVAADREAAPEHLALKAWTGALLPGEFGQVVLGGLQSDHLVRLGMAAGYLVLRGQRASDRPDTYELPAVTEDVVHLLAPLDDERLAWVLTGYFTVATSITQILILALAVGPRSTMVAARHAPAPTAEIAVRTQAEGSAVTLPLTRDLDVLEVTAGCSHLDSVAALAKGLDWTALEAEGLLERAAQALAVHPVLLMQALASALDSQKGPARRRASAARLEALVSRQLAVPASAPPSDPTQMITQLIRLSSPALKDLAARWMTQAPLTDPLLSLVVAADDGSATQPSRYAAARRSIGRGQAGIAGDEDRDDETRVAALRRATAADPAQAREAALTAIAGAGLDLRQAAAHVLATTPGNAAEAPQIERLLGEEEDAEVARLLRQAQRRLASGTLGEALANLVQLIGASPALADLDIAVCLPFPQWHDTFRACVDHARSATTEGTQSRINSFVVLSDLLADQAIAATYLAASHPKEQEKGRLIAANLPGRPEAGALAWDGALRQKLIWLPVWAGLRAERVAHPAPLGDTAHRDISEADAMAALVALRRVSEGWLRAMYATAGTPFPLDGA